MIRIFRDGNTVLFWLRCEANIHLEVCFILLKESFHGNVQEKAWDEDINGGTKVCLVKDRETGVIVFFFALKSGLLYRAIDADEYDLLSIDI